MITSVKVQEIYKILKKMTMGGMNKNTALLSAFSIRKSNCEQ